MARAKTTSCRLRKVICSNCGYTARIARSWMQIGLPSCPCGGTLEPDTPADRAYCGLITAADMSQAAWNAICRENGWDVIRNQGQAARTLTTSALHAALKPQCSYPGCGKWTAAGDEYCHDHAVAEVSAIPF